MNKTADILEAAVTEALETMAFMTLLPPDEEAADPPEAVLVRVQFTGARSGAIEIMATAAFCGALAMNIAASDESSDAVCADALKEFCNVACGLVLPRLAESPADVFNVTVPSLHQGGSVPSWSQFCQLPGAGVFNVDGFPVAARLALENGQSQEFPS